MADFNYPLIDLGISQFEKTNPAYNNPGAIMSGSFARAQGATGTAPNGLAIFPDSLTGWKALDGLVGVNAARGVNISELITKWAPPNAPGNSPQSTGNYINWVSEFAGLDPYSQIPGAKVPAGSVTLPDGRTAPGKDAPVMGDLGSSTVSAATLWDWATNPARIVLVIVGIIIIAAGVFSLRPVQDGVKTVVNYGKKAAAIAA